MHLNAIKSFEVWRSILPVISNSLMCKNSYIIFQNFEKCNLPWQWHFVSLLIKEKKAILQTFFPGGTIHLKLIDKVPTALVKKSINFDFSVDEISNNIDFMIETLLKNQSYNFLFNSNFSNIVFGILAYSFFYINNVTLKDWYTKKIDNQFLKQNSVYHNDLFKKS